MKNITQSTTMQGLLAAATPIVMSWLSWSELAREDRALLIVGSLGWLWAVWGRWRAGDLTMKPVKPDDAASGSQPEPKEKT